MKKILLMLLCAAMLPTMAWAEGGQCNETVNWDLTDGVLTISGTGEMPNYATVGNTSPWFKSRQTITKIIVEEGITKIGESSCYGCTICTELELPSTLTDINGTGVFSSCNALESITCKATVPPVCKTGATGYTNAFKNVPAECILYVPAASVEAYKGAAVWKDQAFIANTKAISDTPSDVESVRVEGKAQKVMRDGKVLILSDGCYYDLQGRTSK